MKYLLLIAGFIFSLNTGLIYSQVNETQRRFTKPLDEETSEKEFIQNKFSDFVPEYTNSVFLNYNISNNTFPQNETSVKISRKNPNLAVAAFRDFRQGVSPANRRVGYSNSTDGGITWSVSKLLDSTLISGFPRNSDPAVGVDTAGNFYVAVICISYSGTGALAIYKSTDGGETFPSAYMIANSGSEDKEYITTDFTPGSPFKNNIYISWTRFSSGSGIKLTKSTNGGVNWTSAVNISTSATGGQGSDLAVGLNGEIYVTWVGGTFTDDEIYFCRSTNGGTSFDTVKTVATGATPDIPISSSGVTFPSIATDISGGPGNGNIYITWCDARSGDPDIYIIRSTNRGITWSSPLRVNDDPLSNGKLQCWPWIEVNDSGKIAIVYYDSRNTSSNSIIESYLAYSTNAGISFTNYELSTEPTPTVQPNSDVRFGDYIGIDFFKDRIIPVWTDERLGGTNQECFTAIVSNLVDVKSLTNIIPEKYNLNQNYPNPFNPSTKIKYEIPFSGFVTLKVYDLTGNEISTLVNGKQNEGVYEVSFAGNNLSSGTYFYRIMMNNDATGESFTDTKKMMLIK
jgi:hypothetical protein